MALSLNDPETDALARQVASLTGETLTEAVRTSLRQRLQHERLRRVRVSRAEIDAVVRRVAALPILDDRSADEIWATTKRACRADGDRQLRLLFSTSPKGCHRAALNFGDCFSYALAKATSQPLLFKGDDFGHTDVVVAA